MDAGDAAQPAISHRLFNGPSRSGFCATTSRRRQRSARARRGQRPFVRSAGWWARRPRGWRWSIVRPAVAAVAAEVIFALDMRLATRLGFSALSAALMVLSVPTFDCWPLMWVALVPALHVALTAATPRRALLQGWLTGCSPTRWPSTG